MQVGLNATGGAALRYNPSEVYAEVGGESRHPPYRVFVPFDPGPSI